MWLFPRRSVYAVEFLSEYIYLHVLWAVRVRICLYFQLIWEDQVLLTVGFLSIEPLLSRPEALLLEYHSPHNFTEVWERGGGGLPFWKAGRCLQPPLWVWLLSPNIHLPRTLQSQELREVFVRLWFRLEHGVAG